MKMPALLTPEVVEELARIGRDRLPAEACGVLLPAPWKGQQVWEMPNRSMTSGTQYEMHASDIEYALDGWSRDTGLGWDEITVWHTHPSGSTSASDADMQNRLPECGNLLIALGEKPLATWF